MHRVLLTMIVGMLMISTGCGTSTEVKQGFYGIVGTQIQTDECQSHRASGMDSPWFDIWSTSRARLHPECFSEEEVEEVFLTSWEQHKHKEVEKLLYPHDNLFLVSPPSAGGHPLYGGYRHEHFDSESLTKTYETLWEPTETQIEDHHRLKDSFKEARHHSHKAAFDVAEQIEDTEDHDKAIQFAVWQLWLAFKCDAIDFDEETNQDLLDRYPIWDYYDTKSAIDQIHMRIGEPHLPLEFVQRFDLPEELVQEHLEYTFKVQPSTEDWIEGFLNEGYDRDQVVWTAVNTLINNGRQRNAIRIAIAHLEPSEVAEVKQHIADTLYTAGAFDLADVDGKLVPVYNLN
jgi:hypothetical protein